LELARNTARRCVEDPPPGAPADIVQAASVQWARIEFQRGAPAEAERVLRDAANRVPDDAVTRFFLGDLLRRTGDLPGALRELELARVSPIRHTNLPLPVAGLKRAIRWQLAEVLEICERPADAARTYREILVDHPEDAAAHLACARASIAAGETAAAEQSLDRIAMRPELRAEVMMLRATIAFNDLRDEESRSLFEMALSLAPRKWAIPLHLGHLSLRAGKPDEARSHYQSALTLGDRPEVRVGLAAAELEAGNLVEALEQLASVADACANRPVPPGTHSLAGETLLRLGRPAEARGAFERQLQLQGPDPRVLSRLADCYRDLGVTDAARVGYQHALTLAPGLPEAVRGLEALASS
jgi:Flp pilus assembly protein TadD